MPILLPPRCPQCGTDLDLVLAPLWSSANPGGPGLLKGAVALHCPACGVPLRIVQYRIGSAITACLVIVIGLVAAFALGRQQLPTELVGPIELAGYVGVVVLGVLLWRSAPRLARVRILRPGEDVTYPLESTDWPDPSAPVSDGEAVADRPAPGPIWIVESPPGSAAASAPAPVAGSEGDEWICAACRAENPTEFLVCWKCQAPHPGFTLAPKSDAAEAGTDLAATADEVSPAPPRP